MAVNIPIDLYNKIEQSVGKEKAIEVAKLVEDTINYIDERVLEETKKRKIELREDLRKELATKEDVLLVRQELETVRQELNGKIDSVREELNGKIDSLRQELKGEMKVLKMWIFFLGALMVVLNQNSLELIARLLGNIFK
jgi:benzoyl-CoA reductase/2-hydroxyglutaryl-CoA dehydratase subunit BcrC/BadD/HgdB